MLFEIKCPHCGNTMKVSTRDKFLIKRKGSKVIKKHKKCVYCGYSFTWYKSIGKNQITKRLR